VLFAKLLAQIGVSPVSSLVQDRKYLLARERTSVAEAIPVRRMCVGQTRAGETWSGIWPGHGKHGTAGRAEIWPRLRVDLFRDNDASEAHVSQW